MYVPAKLGANEEKANILVFPLAVLITFEVDITSLPVVYHCLNLSPLSQCSSTACPMEGVAVMVAVSNSLGGLPTEIVIA